MLHLEGESEGTSDAAPPPHYANMWELPMIARLGTGEGRVTHVGFQANLAAV